MLYELRHEVRNEDRRVAFVGTNNNTALLRGQFRPQLSFTPVSHRSLPKMFTSDGKFYCHSLLYGNSVIDICTM